MVLQYEKLNLVNQKGDCTLDRVQFDLLKVVSSLYVLQKKNIVKPFAGIR